MDIKTILIVDDEKYIREILKIQFNNAGFDVFACENGKVALDIFDKESIHLIILDLMMPVMDGEECCRQIRKRSKGVPIIVLSAKGEYVDKVNVLNMGADDYVVKPFNPEELLARVRAQFRRLEILNKKDESLDIVEIDALTVDLKKRIIKVKEELVRITPIEFAILEFLIQNRGKVFSISEIYEFVWREKYFESDNTVMVHIRRLRGKIEEEPNNPKIIKTVWGVGYKIE